LSRWTSTLGRVATCTFFAVAFLAIGWLGMQLAADPDAEAGRNAAPATTTTEAPAPVKAPALVKAPAAVKVRVKAVKRAAPPRATSWAKPASVRCAQALEQLGAIAHSAPEPGATTEEHVLGVVDRAVRNQGQLLLQLQALPASRADRQQVEEALSLLEGQVRAGENMVAALRVRWDDALLEETDFAQKATSERLEQLFVELGAPRCAEYQQGPS